MQNILFRADSSSTIGTGHIMRDLVLAEQFKDTNITFATQKLDGNINHKIEEKQYSIEILSSNELQELDTLIKKLAIDMIVIDHYEIEYSFEKQLKTHNPQLKILSFDDTYERHYCDILLNHNISANSQKYQNLVPENCELWCGSKYTLLRDEFLNFKSQDITKRRANKLHIFIAIGGSDPQGYNFIILTLLANIHNIHITVVTTEANQKLKELQVFIENMSNTSLHVNSQHLAMLMQDADIAIITPSVIANEIIFMQIPFIAIKIIDNQNDMYKFLKDKGFFVLESSEIIKLPEYINSLRKSNIYNGQLHLLKNLIQR